MNHESDQKFEPMVQSVLECSDGLGSGNSLPGTLLQKSGTFKSVNRPPACWQGCQRSQVPGSAGRKLLRVALAPNVVLGVLAAVLVTNGSMAASSNLPGDWPTYGKGPAHTGYFPGRLNGLPLALKWKKPMAHTVISQAAVSGGTVYVSVGYYYSAISLVAMDANTGQGLWTNGLTGAYISPPTYDSGSVYVQEGDSGNPGYIWSLDAATGHTNWTTSFISQAYRYMAPVVAGGSIFTDTGYYHGLTGLDEGSGFQLWFTQLAGSEQWAPAYYNGEVYTWLGSFSEWDPTYGNANWTLTNGLSGNASSRTVTVADGRAYFTSDASLYCINLATHTNAWSLSGPFGGTPSVANGLVYVVSNSVVSAYTTNGAYVRSYAPSGGGGATLYGQLIVTDDVLIAGGSYGFYIFRLADGSIQQYFSSAEPPYGIYYSSVVSLANNTLYVTSSDQNVYAYAPTPTTAIRLTNPSRQAGGFQFGFTNIPGATFSVWGSTNPALALSNWTPLGYVTNGSPGQYQFTDTNTAASTRRFYRVSSP